MTKIRYVVLHHTGFGEPHFDLMVESSPGARLMTWRAADWPPAAGDVLTRIGDHRREYLDYEGPVSDNRGEVRRIASGECELSMSGEMATIRMASPTRMLLLLRKSEGDLWRITEVDS